MESHAKRCLQQHVWHGIPCQSNPKLGLTWNSMSIPWWHVPCQMQHFRRVLGYINLTWDSMANWCHRAHTILSWSSMSNLTWVPCQTAWHGIPCQRVLSERTGTILHRFHTGSPFKGCFQRFGMGEQAFTFLCVSLIFAQNDLRNENENRTHNNDNEKRKQHMETEKLTISTSKQTGHNKATHW